MMADAPEVARRLRIAIVAAFIVVGDLILAVMGLFGPLFFVAVGVAAVQLWLAVRRPMTKPVRYANILGALWVYGFLSYVLVRS